METYIVFEKALAIKNRWGEARWRKKGDVLFSSVPIPRSHRGEFVTALFKDEDQLCQNLTKSRSTL